MQTEIKPTEKVPVGIDSDEDRWSDKKEREMNTNPYNVDLDVDGLKYPEVLTLRCQKKTPGL